MNKLTFKKRKQIPDPSIEQLGVVNQVKAGHNVIVDSVFGSGKTTTILHIAQMTGLKCLCFTYSKYLKEETRVKTEKMGLDNIEVHSFHSFGVKYYHDRAFNNIGLVKKKMCQPKRHIPEYDLVIIDEIQDMTPDLYEFVSYISGDLAPKQYVLIGDQYQCIFKFKNADNRYLTLGKKLFRSDRKWVECKLTVSYRVTRPIADFVNKQLVGYNRVKAVKDGAPVKYMIVDPFKHMDEIADMVKGYLKKGYRADDIFILAPSVKSTSGTPLNTLEHLLVYHKIPVVVQNNEKDNKMSQEEMVGKVVFCTFHSVKGLERKICIVFGFDDSYFKFFDKEVDPNICPATIYVACSRSIEHLTVIHSFKNNYMNFIDQRDLEENSNIDLINLTRIKLGNSRKKEEENVSVTDLVKYIPDKLVNRLCDNLSIRDYVSRKGQKKINTKTLIKMGEEGMVENVSTLYGTAIPFIKELMMSKDNQDTYFGYIKSYLNQMRMMAHLHRIERLEKSLGDDTDQWDFEELMFMTNCYMMIHSGYIYQVEQIRHYKWVDAKAIKLGIERLSLYIDENNMFEVPMEKVMSGIKVVGRPDAVDDINRVMWEFKFVEEITREHLLQLVCYAWISGYDLDVWKLYIFNIKNGEIIEIDKVLEIDQIVGDLIHQKFYNKNVKLDDNGFMKKNLEEGLVKKRIILGPTGPGRPIPCI